jgi:hypothetical protein
MSSFASKWPVLLELPVTADDLDADGMLTPPARERLFAAVREAYLAGCSTLAGRALDVRDVVVAPGGAPVEPGDVTVSAAVVEIFPDRFTMHVRIRPGAGGEGIAAHGWGDVVVEGGVTDDVRDELIAQAHSASFYN